MHNIKILTFFAGAKELKIQKIKAVIMAGGMGTRLMPLTKEVPKPLMPVLGRPVIFYTIDLLRNSGINDIAVTLMHMPDMIIDKINQNFSGRFDYFIEQKPLGTAGSIKAAKDWLDDQTPFIVISGDALTNIDLNSIYKAHSDSNADVTMAVTEVKNPSQYGLVKTDSEGYITDFLEKPKSQQTDSNLINCGIYIISPKVLKNIPKNIPFDFARDLFPILIKNRQKIFTYRLNGYWCDIGCIEEYFKANMDMLYEKNGLDMFTKNIQGLYNTALRRTYMGKRSFIGLKVDIGNNVIIGDNCYIDGNISLSDCIIADNTFLDVSCHSVIATPEHYIPVQTYNHVFQKLQDNIQTATNNGY